MALVIQCAKCDTEWYGTGMCHCSDCHKLFGGVSPFDKHQPKGNCTDPTTIDGFYESRPGVWSYAKPPTCEHGKAGRHSFGEVVSKDDAHWRPRVCPGPDA